MAYYTALINVWTTSSASSGALPSGVAGTSLFGLTTADVSNRGGETSTCAVAYRAMMGNGAYGGDEG
jgi:hypothetical protein